MKKIITFLLFALVSSLTLPAQVKMVIDAPDVVDLSEDYFQIRFTVNEVNVSNFTPPSFENFELLSGPYSSVRSSTSFVNGKSTHEASTTYTYTLAPVKAGEYTIGEATAVVNGKSVHSSSHTIKVTGTGKKAQKGQTKPSRRQQTLPKGTNVSNKDLFLTVHANHKKIYEQEPVLLTYKFYAQPDVMLSQIGIQKKPDFKGMLSQDFPVGNIYMEIEEVNGISYRSGVIQKYLIFPQGAGKITIPGVTFNCDIMQRDLSIDPFEAFFNGGGTISRTIQRKVNDIDLEILPLPQPQPATFTGGVGDFSIKGEMLTSEYKTNDVVSYRITISGTGNLKLIETPQLKLTDDFDTYSPKTTDKTRITEQGITGKMVYDYTFVPRKVGDYVLPAVELTYFDPSTEKYKTVSTQEISMHVVKGEKTNEEYQRSQNIQRSDIREMHNSSLKTTAPDHYFWWGDWSYWLSYVLVVILALSGSFVMNRYRSRYADMGSLKRKKAGKMATRRLKKAKALLHKNDRTAFYAEISHTMYDYVSDKYAIDLADLNRARIEAELQGHDVDASAIATFLHLLDECDFAQYAPNNQVMGMSEMYNAVYDAIISIEK